MIWTAIKSFFACAWSALSYLPPWGKKPADNPSYWKNCFGFNDSAPDLMAAWAAYRKEGGFHLLKDILVEWVKVWPQRAGKLLALGGCLLGVLGFVTGVAVLGTALLLL